MTAKFTVPGEPIGKGRPRFRIQKNKSTNKSFVMTYTDQKTQNYELKVKHEYRRQCKGIRFDDSQMLDMRIRAYYKIPISATRGEKTAMEAGVVRPTKTPDADNVIKAIADALNKLAYKDDSQIVDCQIRKYYSHQPRVEITLLPAKNERREL